MRRSISTLLLLVTLAMGAAGCNDDTTNTPTTPTTPTTPLTFTQTFSGALNTNGGATSPFTATTGGTVTATLTTISPDATVAVGMSLGTWTGSACQVVIANDNAVQGAIITGTVTSAASLCVRIYDVGKVTSAVNYTISVVRPSLTGTD
jgi:ABC-type glycerol-3-phosphate transport system substrate-binding protein